MLVTIDVYSSHNPRSATVGKGNIYLLFSLKPIGARNECPSCHVFRGFGELVEKSMEKCRHNSRSATVGKGNIYLLFSFKPKGARNECPFCHVFRGFRELVEKSMQKCWQFRRFSKLVERTMDGKV